MDLGYKSNLNNIQQQKSTVILESHFKHSRWIFISLCLYLLSQAFTIPIIGIGPWAMWLNLSDLAIGLMFLTLVVNFRHAKQSISSANDIIFRLLGIIFFLILASYIWYLINLIDINSNGLRLGSYQIYRLIQFICIFGVTARIPLTRERIDILRHIVEFVLIFVCLSVILTFTQVIPLDMLTAHLPEGKSIAGHWSDYARLTAFGGKGLGTISYNHAYVAAQITMLASLRIHLGLNKKVVLELLLLLLSLVTSFITESRAGFFGMLIFSAVYMFKKPVYTTVLISILASIFLCFTSITAFSNLDSLKLESVEGSIIERQTTLLDAGNAENLSGRDSIWQDKVKYLYQENLRWIVGTGFGSAWDEGEDGGSAHMLFLHIIIENVIVGLLIFLFLFGNIIIYLQHYELGIKPIFWVTISLLVTSITQETFYPIPAQGHFIGFYLCSVAIALRKNIDVKISDKNSKIGSKYRNMASNKFGGY
mgnify:CR=1 FL=1